MRGGAGAGQQENFVAGSLPQLLVHSWKVNSHASLQAGLPMQSPRQLLTAESHWMVHDCQLLIAEQECFAPQQVTELEVLEQVPLKKVRTALAARKCASAEILVRGVDANPDALRKQWKLGAAKKGGGKGAALGVVVTRIGSSATAFICGKRQWGPGA